MSRLRTAKAFRQGSSFVSIGNRDDSSLNAFERQYERRLTDGFCQPPELCADALRELMFLVEGDKLLPEGFGFVEESLAG